MDRWPSSDFEVQHFEAQGRLTYEYHFLTVFQRAKSATRKGMDIIF